MLPNFFCPAASAPRTDRALSGILQGRPTLTARMPSLFKERLFVHLSRFCEVRYSIVRHVGFLIGNGILLVIQIAAQTIDQVVALLRRPMPNEAAFAMPCIGCWTRSRRPRCRQRRRNARPMYSTYCP